MKLLFLHAVFFFVFGGALPAQAKSLENPTLSLSDATPVSVLKSVEQLSTQAGKVRSSTARRDFVSDAKSLSEKLRTMKTFDDLSEKQRIELVNQYESLRSRVAGANERGKRRICQRVRPTGSNLTTTICQTQDEIDKGAESVEAANVMNSRRPFSEQ